MTGDTTGVELARVVGPWCDSSWYGKEVALANGRLITASPDLYGAALLLIALRKADAHDADTRWKSAWQMLEDAVALVGES
jgi:hypothetical protein